MNNYQNVLAQLKLAGLQVQDLEVDGKVHRCRTTDSAERRGWYLLHEWRTSSGADYIVGSYGIWQGNNSNSVKVELDKGLLDDTERVALKARLAEDRKRASAQRASEAKRAAGRAATVWAKGLKAPPDGQPVDYLVRKGVQAYGLRYTESGALMVPMMDGQGSIQGLQFILPSGHERIKKTGRDKEYWPRGLQKTGHWFQIGSVYAGGVCLLAEGYATGATLHAATGLPVAVAFDAGNLLPVAQALRKQLRVERILVCADDDYLQRCPHCRKLTAVANQACEHCGEKHGQFNPGSKAASAAAMAVAGAWTMPIFPGDRGGKKLTDFNDLQAFPQGGLPLVRAQIEMKLAEAGWTPTAGASGRLPPAEGGGEESAMAARITVDDAALRYIGTYGMGGKVLFDSEERRLIHKDDVMNLLPSHGWDLLKNHPAWRVVRDHEIGFDPTESDPAVKCNLFGGWPTRPKAGDCSTLIELLMYLCSQEPNADEVFQWMIKWLAYPLQHLGAKMHSAIVIHGPQGTGKSRFFEAYARIFGPYGKVLGQEALEDKFNSDWAEKKLFILADEVLARTDMYHIKNRLKGFITGDTIRVNPKNIAAHNEKNQMNIVFLSNERMPLVLENDDRRHCVIWVPPKLPDSFFAAIDVEIEAGGVEALHDYLLKIDLGDFKPWTRPPMTGAKRDLIQQSLSSEERFLADWMNLELEGKDGDTLPFCPCLGSHLYRAYELWCNASGERARRAQELIGLCSKRPGWKAGATQSTWTTLNDASVKIRKMVVPSEVDMAASLRTDKSRDGTQSRLMPDRFETKGRWMTAGFFAFETAMGSSIKAVS